MKTRSIFQSMLLVVISGLLLLSVAGCLGENEEEKEARLMKAFEEETHPILKELYEVYQIEEEKVVAKIENASNSLKSVLHDMGGFNTNSKGEIYGAINQYTKEEILIELPIIRLGGMPFYPVVADTIVDELSEKYGCELTVFQKMNDQGDLLRVATTIRKLDGKRAIGTFIPAVNPDGQENPVNSVILSGQVYVGRAFIVNAWYKTRYEPIKDNSGNVIGCLQTACKIDYQDSVRKKMISTIIGKTGLVFAIGGKGDQRGKYIISFRGMSDGKNILGVTDTKGRPIIKEMIELAMAADKGEVTYYTYPWMNRGENKPRMKAAALIYFEEWDWVVGGSAYLEEFEFDGDYKNISAFCSCSFI
jgi:methyl-accepting chemotaxis protein